MTNHATLFDLRGKVAVVTGGGRGIGRAIAQALAAHGAAVAVCGRTAGTLADVTDTITIQGAQALAVTADVASDDEIRRLRETVLDRFGQIDILVNNAGIDPHYASMEHTTAAEWHQILDVNLSGVYRCCRELGAAMLPRRQGAIINISSIAGHIGLKRQVPYAASKGGVEQLTRALAHDWAEHGIRVNAIAYGFVQTDLTAGVVAHPHIGAKLLSRIPMGRFGNLDDVPGAAVFLASPAAAYVTGHSLLVDGGWTAT
ncbi:SDR family NAD(P)-dependent oxidoreductase [Cupriavidus oxalaticus]|uniref:Glucose 1-dehydrogenase n=1 Tax=Cupriavidus oxalaticus TaxID=96344 RepID=A0A4P7LJC0_9BURK|nr:glucose 1-dehydrogenase [Cupriavidus oxalaticus]QBY56246.1 glucose 1-dehydrogenase [Cupriavidus oxalaticus]